MNPTQGDQFVSEVVRHQLMLIHQRACVMRGLLVGYDQVCDSKIVLVHLLTRTLDLFQCIG